MFIDVLGWAAVSITIIFVFVPSPKGRSRLATVANACWAIYGYSNYDWPLVFVSVVLVAAHIFRSFTSESKG